MSGNMHADRTYAVTGTGSGIGAATAAYLRGAGARVIDCDLRDAEVVGDLATTEGRRAVVEGVARACGGRLDGIVANAGGGPARTMLALNFFGALATLEGLRPLLGASAAPRAVAVASIAGLGPYDQALVEACLAGDEAAAGALAAPAVADSQTALLYASAKQALMRWCRRSAQTPAWAGEGVTLNAVAPGIIDTPAAGFVLDNPEMREQFARLSPLRGAYPGQPGQLAALLAWCVSPENALMTGQILCADGGFDCVARGEAVF
jgi:NAD(P)-dependent dehydrogenase (short-subunit alcohol dehydrogenase family)